MRGVVSVAPTKTTSQALPLALDVANTTSATRPKEGERERMLVWARQPAGMYA